MNWLLKVLRYVVIKGVTPGTVMNRLAKIKFFNYLDEKFIETRSLFLEEYLKTQEEVIQFPRLMAKSFWDGVQIYTPKDKTAEPSLILLKADPTGRNTAFIKAVNQDIKGMHPVKLDYDTQNAYGDVWDHLLYGLMVSTCCAEIGALGGVSPGTLNEARLRLLVGEPNYGSSKGLQSCGPFGINDINWRHLKHNLPSDNVYVHLAYFMYSARYAHKQVMASWKKEKRPFADTDPSWLVDIYERRDQLGYAALFRRWYGGSGNFFKIPDPKDPSKYLDGNAYARRILAFSVNAISIAMSRSAFIKNYPSSFKDHAYKDVIDGSINHEKELQNS